MKKLFTLLSIFPSLLFAQTFTNSIPVAIPDNQTDLYIPIQVAGLTPAINMNFGINTTCLMVNHSHVADLKLRLQSPSGTIVLLADQRGGNGSGYFGTCFAENGSDGDITDGVAPFNGTFYPQESINAFNDGSDPNGTWNLIITDMFNFSDSGFFQYANITFGMNPPPNQTSLICNTSDASGCFCPDGGQDCDLLPDLQSSDDAQTPAYWESLGSVNVSNATPNIGWGPLEINSANNCFCDTVSVPCATAACPDGNPPTQMVNQRIYHKNGNSMTYWDRPAGTMAYHASHGHIHVDDWVWIDLRRKTGDPNPLNWPLTGIGNKQSYCLVNLGDCTSSFGVCHDDAGNFISQADIPNSNLGSVAGCGLNQGIYVGQFDTYGSINIPLPVGTCNGEYYALSIVDPLDHMLEQSETNNWILVRVNLAQQTGGNFEPDGFMFTIHLDEIDATSNATTADSCVWNWGDGSPLQHTIGTPLAHHVFPGVGQYIVEHYAYNHCGVTYTGDTIRVLTVGVNDNIEAVSSWNVFPNPAKDKINIEYTLVNNTDVQLEITDALGHVIKQMENSNQDPGKYHVSLDLSKDNIKSGIYFVKLGTRNKTLNQRFIVLK
ncbi:MAG: T9SS type A sorting domain-containing protein [Bacteroidota bacterium]